MAIIFNRTNPVTTTATVVAEEREQSVLWLNVGYTCEIDGEEVFISLPFNLSLDSMKEIKVGKPGSKWSTIASLKNQLLHDLRELILSQNQGEGKVVAGLEIQALHAEEAASENVVNVVNLGKRFVA